MNNDVVMNDETTKGNVFKCAAKCTLGCAGGCALDVALPVGDVAAATIAGADGATD